MDARKCIYTQTHTFCVIQKDVLYSNKYRRLLLFENDCTVCVCTLQRCAISICLHGHWATGTPHSMVLMIFLLIRIVYNRSPCVCVCKCTLLQLLMIKIAQCNKFTKYNLININLKYLRRSSFILRQKRSNKFEKIRHSIDWQWALKKGYKIHHLFCEYIYKWTLKHREFWIHCKRQTKQYGFQPK